MATSVHIPPQLLAAVDRRAKLLQISRNRLIVKALEHELEQRGWTPGFFDKLGEIDPGAVDALRDSMAFVRTRRRSKPVPKL
jgi:predicted transcriptional regulator